MRFSKIELLVVCLFVALLCCAQVVEAQSGRSVSGTLSPSSITAGSTVTLSGTASATTTADGNGNYSFTGLAKGSYAVTPAKPGLTFSPASQNVNLRRAGSTLANFVAKPLLQSITLSAGATSIVATGNLQFTAIGAFSDGSTQNLTNSVTWSSSNTSAATISAGGLASGIAAGSTGITATLSGITSNSFMLTVTAVTLQSITISAMNSSIAKGTGVQFTATGTFSDGSTQNLTNTATWASSSPVTVNISATGLATGVAIGSSSITTTQNGITSNSFALTVTAAKLQSIAVRAASASLATGSSEQLTATGTFSDGSTQNVTSSTIWSSSNPAAISLDASAMALAAGVGQSVIAASQGGTTGTMTISSIARISGSVSPASSAVGTTITLSGAASATTTPDANGNYSFTVLADGTYNVTPSNSSFSFVPASMSVTVNNANVAGINFVTGSGQLSVSPSGFVFGSVGVGSTAQIPATLAATGGDVTITGDVITGSGFGLSGLAFPITIPSGRSAAFSVTFTPPSTGSASGAITLNNGTTTLSTTNLSGTGAGLTVSPSSLSFGEILDGTTSASQTLTLNAVGSSVTVTSDNIVQNGGGGSAFSITGLPTLPFTIAAGQSTKANVTFAPAPGSPGTAAGSVTFASSVNSVAPTFSGTGTSNVVLAWNASTTPSVTYNVYRCATSASACVQAQPANFVRIATGVGSLTYTDAAVSSGQTYYYALTAVDTNSVESSLSTVSSATAIP